VPEVIRVYGKGPRGPHGPAGPSGNNAYTFSQDSPSAEWDITLPGFNTFLNVVTTDNAGTVIHGGVAYDLDDPDHVTISFSVPLSGYAHFS
jgi:hypothetical protein